MSMFEECSGLVSLIKEPVAVSHVPGFEISINKKQLDLKNFAMQQCCKVLGIDFCYQVQVHVDGSNPEYPNEETLTEYFGYSLPGRNTIGGRECFQNTINSSQNYIDPSYQRWGDFELKEKFEDPSNSHNPNRKPHSYRQVWLMSPDIEVKERNNIFGAHVYSTGRSSSGWVRKSDRETDEWKEWQALQDAKRTP